MPKGKGMWPAFWMLGTNIGAVGWPECGEIDIMEWVDNDPNNIYSSTHATGKDNTKGIWGDTWST
jgi:beta-glucanase (GH16 family)